jgi:hypothetical protein
VAERRSKAEATDQKDVKVIRRPRSACVGVAHSAGRPRKKPRRKKRKKTNKGKPVRLAPPLSAHGTQFTRTPHGKELPVVIGLDFGTASTKVIVRTPYVLNGKAYAVRFDEHCGGGNPYLLPSRLVETRDGEFELGGESGARKVIPNVKGMLMGIVNAPAGQDAMELATWFLALVLQNVRGWFLQSLRNTHADRQLSWWLQIGIPAAGHDDDQVRTSFERAARAAWIASLAAGRPDARDIRSAIEASANPEMALRDCEHVEAIPEVAAEVVGYARSDRRREGLHFLVDVGATTLDVCGFRLDSDGAVDHYKLYSTEITKHGTSCLQRSRFEALREVEARTDPIAPLPPSFLTSLPDYLLAQTAVNEAENDFARAARLTITRVLWHVRKDRDPNASAWRHGVPIFRCGGGGEAHFFREVIDELDSWLRKHVDQCPGARILPLERPPHDRLDADIDPFDFHRLAVAWGLSYPDVEIGEIIRPQAIEDMDREERRTVFPDYVGAEQM